ncbi:hypothetical protein [Labrys sp. 22185]|uniref:hypothetical protein n=1 Tax=Labrys sp. 22185 TaxID=3453888 RepID=UPI003F85DAED
MTDTIRLNGQVVEWDDRNDQECMIEENELEAYQGEGWIVAPFGDKHLAVRFGTFADGTIQLQQKSDMMGRMAAQGGHTNLGYSGYFKGYVYLDGKRKRLVDWWALFPGQEHHFPRQMDARRTVHAIRLIVEALAGTDVVKVKGGYAFNLPG